MDKSIGAVVLAAGKGTRMHSQEPKVLRPLLGEPMLRYVLEVLTELFSDRVHVVIGHQADKVRRAFPEYQGRFVLQEEQKGTGHALQCAWADLKARGYEYILVMNGDVPMARAEDLSEFVLQTLTSRADMAFLSIELSDPGAYGRVARDDSGQTRIVEAKDYEEAIFGPASCEINAGIYMLRVEAVGQALFELSDANKSGEFYITDLAGLIGVQGGRVTAVNRGLEPNLLGINTPGELVMAEERLRERIVAGWQDRGVIIRAPGAARIGPRVEIAPGAELSGPCDILGQTSIAAEARLDPHVWVRDCRLAEGSTVLAFSHLEGARLDRGSQAGPYARLRPGAVMEEASRVGNFVEMKKTVLGAGAKASHLTYLGDAEVGAGSNIGAGTITCNYDGKLKHKTSIGEGAFIGSNTALVAPVTVGAGAVVGAGSVITKDVPEKALAVARGKQVNLIRRKNLP